MKMRAAVLVILVLFVGVALAQPGREADLGGSRVEIPWSEFSEILRKISQPVVKTLPDTVFPPVDYLISGVVISGTVVERKVAKITCRATVQVLNSSSLRNNGWVKVPLGAVPSTESKAVLERAELDGITLPVSSTGNELEVLISRAGIHQIKIDYYCPVVNEEGSWKFSVSLPKAAAAQLNLLIPGIPVDLWANGIQRDVKIGSEGSRFESVLSLEDELVIRFSQTGDDLGGGVAGGKTSPKTFASTGLLMMIKENRVDYQFRIDYQIWHQKRRSFSVLLPEFLAVETVQGQGLADWKIEKTAAGLVLTAWTSFSPDRSYSLLVEASHSLDPTVPTVVIPSLRVMDVTRESGVIAVSASKATEIFASDTLENLTVADQEDLPDWIRSGRDVLMCFKYPRTPYHMKLSVQRHKDMAVLVAIADEVTFGGLLTEEGHWLVKYRYFIRNNHKQFLRVGLPEGWMLWSALIDNEAVMPASAPTGNQVLIPLKKLSRIDEGAGFVLELVYWNEAGRMRSGGRIAFQTPVIDINCRKINGTLYLPDRFSYRSFGGTLQKVDNYISTYFNVNMTSADQFRSRGSSFRNMQKQYTNLKRGAVQSLPVQVDIPERGKAHHFVNNLTIAGEIGEVRLRYSSQSGVWPLASSLLFLLGHLAAGFAVFYIIAKKRKKRFLVLGAVALLVLGGCLNLFYGLIQSSGESAFGALFLGGVAAMLLSLRRTSRKEQVYE